MDSYYPRHAEKEDALADALAEITALRERGDAARVEICRLGSLSNRLAKELATALARIQELTKALMRFDS